MVLKHDRFSNNVVLGFQSRRNNHEDFNSIYKKVMLEKDFKCLRYAWNRGCYSLLDFSPGEILEDFDSIDQKGDALKEFQVLQVCLQLWWPLILILCRLMCSSLWNSSRRCGFVAVARGSGLKVELEETRSRERGWLC